MKHFFKLFVLVTLLFETGSLFAKTYKLQDFSIEVPDSFLKVNSDELLLYLVDKTTGNAMSIIYGDNGSFGSHDPLYKYGDISKLKTRKSFFLRLNKKYIKKYYYSSANISFMQYTFRTYKNVYSILFKYNSEQDIKEINTIVRSLKINDSWFGKVITTFRNGPLLWLLFFIVITFFAAALHNEGEPQSSTWATALVITALSVPLLLLFLWGAWSMFFTFIILTLSITYLAARSGYFIAPQT